MKEQNRRLKVCPNYLTTYKLMENYRLFFRISVFTILLAGGVLSIFSLDWFSVNQVMNVQSENRSAVMVQHAVANDVSRPLVSQTIDPREEESVGDKSGLDISQNDIKSVSTTSHDTPQIETVYSNLVSLKSISVEQTEHGTKPPPEIVASFDGLGEGFEGPQGTARYRNPSDNSLAVGPDHIVQIVNSRMAVYTKKGARFDTTGKVLYGPVPTNNVFKGFDGEAAQINNGDAVVRYDQLADRWLIVMPIFRRLAPRENEPVAGESGGPAQVSQPSVANQPGAAAPLYQPPPPNPEEKDAAVVVKTKRLGQTQREGQSPQKRQGQNPMPQNERASYAMCYAISTSPDPLGSYYRYQFVRPLFPDYPRPAVWPDGYYIPTSTGDDVIQKHAYVAQREKMLKGEPAAELGFVIDDVNFLNNADLDGKQLPPPGAPNIMMATGGAQLKGITEDDGIYVWKFHVDWYDPSRSKLDGPVKIPVAPYKYLGGGQLTNAVPQPGTERCLDAQGDKIMSRLVYRRIGDRESIVAVHSVNTSEGGGGVRWYEFRLDAKRNVRLFQQGTYAPGGFYRWMASPAIDGRGQYRYRLLFCRDAAFCRPAVCWQAVR